MKKTKKLFRLKSNPNAIVEPLGGDRFRVYWSKQMEFGADSSWMICTQSDQNLVELTPKESRNYVSLREAFNAKR